MAIIQNALSLISTNGRCSYNPANGGRKMSETKNGYSITNEIGSSYSSNDRSAYLLKRRCNFLSRSGMLLLATSFLLIFFISSNSTLHSCPILDPTCSIPFDGPYTVTIQYTPTCKVTFEYCIRENSCYGSYYDIFINYVSTDPVNCALFSKDLYMACIDSVVVERFQDIPPCEDGTTINVVAGTPFCQSWYFPTEILCLEEIIRGKKIYSFAKSVPCAEPDTCSIRLEYCWE